MKIKDKMVELKNRGIGFAKEHKDVIIGTGLLVAAELTFYCIGRRDGERQVYRDRFVVKDPDVSGWLTDIDKRYGDERYRRQVFVSDHTNSEDITRISDLGKVGEEYADYWKTLYGTDISDEKVTHFAIITDSDKNK